MRVDVPLPFVFNEALTVKNLAGRKKHGAVQKVIKTPLAAWHTEVRAGQYLHTIVSANNALALDDRLLFWSRKFLRPVRLLPLCSTAITKDRSPRH